MRGRIHARAALLQKLPEIRRRRFLLRHRSGRAALRRLRRGPGPCAQSGRGRAHRPAPHRSGGGQEGVRLLSFAQKPGKTGPRHRALRRRPAGQAPENAGFPSLCDGVN